MTTFVLIHGSWHGGWCWYKVVSRLARAGHRVLALDLPSLGRDKTPVSEVTFQTWTDKVCVLLDEEPDPVVLVGHSRGGIVISSVAEARPRKIKTLVYVAAFLLQDGESVVSISRHESESRLRQHFVAREQQGDALIREEAVRDLFYGCCSDDDVALAKLLLSPEPLAPLRTPVHVTAENFGTVPRVYVECLRDHAVRPALQKKMYSSSPCRQVISMDTDHSPFFSDPDALVAHLISIAESP